jgi:hypothetical protein
MPVRDGSIRYITNSELSTFKRCRRKWWFAYWKRITPVKEDVTGTRGLGTRLHAALRVRYRVDGTAQGALAALEDGLLEDYAMLESQGDRDALVALEKDADLARAMLTGYFEWAESEGVDIGLHIIGDEQEVSAPFNGVHAREPRGHVSEKERWVPVHLLGRLDVRAKRELDGARFFIDHKSVGSFAQATRTLHMSEQMLMYHLLEILEQLTQGVSFNEAERCDGGMYNMLRRVKRTPRAKPPFYAREDVHHNIHELRSFYQRVHSTIKDIIELEDKLSSHDESTHHVIAYPYPTADCTWSCDYFHLCHMMDDGSHAQGFIDAHFESYDPLDRYVQEENGQEGEDGVTHD